MRYIIGIDLGTTNCCVAYYDTTQEARSRMPVQQFQIPQLVHAGYMQPKSMLPSFCYLPSEGEWPAGSLDLPWQQAPSFVVGELAQTQGARTPTRLVQSAKSWLCHPAANRRDPILPIEAAANSPRLSPVEATARYLAHIREAWNHFVKHDPEAEFEAQEIILTVPASFDEVARTLTVEAAQLASYKQMTLLEEPQAAFYSWIAQNEQRWQSLLKPGQTILVCDIGGGTSDFSLIEVVEEVEGLGFQRMQVGDHLLLGGDNMDLAVAHLAEAKLRQQGISELSTLQWLQLIQQARLAKEALMGRNEPVFRVIIQGTGSSVVGGTIALDLSQEDVSSLLLEGFFGQHTWNEAVQISKQSAVQTLGLPYESDPSITKHLARFLQRAQTKKVDYVLFNGGTLNPTLFQQAILTNLQRWLPETQTAILPPTHLDLAVARGAAYFGKARRGWGVRIGGGAARGYYLRVDIKEAGGEVAAKALTLLPKGSADGAQFEPVETFHLKPNTPVQFQLFTSHTRLHDQKGDLIAIDPTELQALPPIRTVLRFGKGQSGAELIPVQLCASLTEIGTLDIQLKALNSTHHWKLEFQLRTESGSENSLSTLQEARQDETWDTQALQEAQQLIIEAFSVGQVLSPGKLPEQLEQILGKEKRDWPPSILRALWDALFKQATHRHLSGEHGVRWWNLIGFLLRPGFGFPLDDHRIKELWRLILGELKSERSQEIQIQTWICYRRIAGGLNKGQQIQLATELMQDVLRKGQIEIKGRNGYYCYSEKIRVLGALELLDPTTKVKWGDALVNRMKKGEGRSADFWALGRIGARHPVYATLPHVVPKEACMRWLRELMQSPVIDDANLLLLVEQLGRLTPHREINIDRSLAEQLSERFVNHVDYQRVKELLTSIVPLTQTEQDYVFGDHLPAGLMLEAQQ